MKILLVSDSHCDNESLLKIANRHPDMDLYLHLGDSESDEFSIKPFISVLGNCDHYFNFEKYLLFNTPQGYIYATHKPPFLDEIANLKKDIKFVLHGHTHKRRFEKIGNILYINPGSISFPRDGHDLSYVILDITEKDVNYQFLNLG